MRQAEGKTSSWLPLKEATMGEGSHDNLRGLRLALYNDELSSREEQRARSPHKNVCDTAAITPMCNGAHNHK